MRPTLHTARLTLRPFRRSDGQALYEMLRRPEAVRYEPYDVQSREECIHLALVRERDERFWAVCQGEWLIGNLYFSPMEEQLTGTWELGFVFNPDDWGQGYAWESGRALLEHAFRTMGVKRVLAFCNPENRASWRLLERLGMVRCRHLRKNVYFKLDGLGQPIWCDTYEYRVTARQWSERRTQPLK